MPQKSTLKAPQEKPTYIRDSAKTFVETHRFLFTVPIDYHEQKELRTYRDLRRGRFQFVDVDLTDEHFKKGSFTLIPGRTYTIVIKAILRNNISTHVCIDHIQAQENARFLGTKGLSLVARCCGWKFPLCRWVVGFDLPKNLWKDGTRGHRVGMYAHRSDDEQSPFACGYTNTRAGWGDEHSIIYLLEE